MTLSVAGVLDPSVATTVTGQLVDLVGAREVREAWQRESALPGMTVGGLTRHLVSQPECAVEFLTGAVPPGLVPLSLVGHYDEVDWFTASIDAPENTSIRDEFNQMGAAGHGDSVETLARAVDLLPAAIADAGPVTYVPWQECALATEDFLVVRLMEMVVHADDLAVSVGVETPRFPSDAVEPVLSLLAALGAVRHGQTALLRALSRSERGRGIVSAFG